MVITATKTAMISVVASITLLLSCKLQFKSPLLPTWSIHRFHSQVSKKAGEMPWEMYCCVAMQVLKTSRALCLSRMMICLKSSLTKSASSSSDSSPFTMTPRHPSRWLPTWLKSDQALSSTITISDFAEQCLKLMTNLASKSMIMHYS